MKNRLKIITLVLFLVASLSSPSFCENEESLKDSDYKISDETADKYINDQLEKINIQDLEECIKGEDIFKNIDLKLFVKDLIKGRAKISDIINFESLKSSIFSQVNTTLKTIIMIIVLALLSSILKSLENSFSNGEISKIINYIIFITMVGLVLINFKEILSISYNTLETIIGIVKVLVPILLALLAIGGLAITSTTLSPLFVGGVSVINVIFKNVVFSLITLCFCVIVVNNLSKNIKLDKFAELLKKVNILIIGCMFTIYLALVSIQGLYVTSFDKFTVKSAKFAVGVIPVIGSFVSDSVDILLSSSILVKNIFGVVGLVLLIGVCMIPIIKIFSIIVIYKIGVAIIEPVGEESLSSFMDEVSKLMTVILISVLAILIMFFVTLSILTSLSIVN